MGRGSSKAGGGAKQPQPQSIEGKSIPVEVRLKDGSVQTVNVSVQDTSQYDNLQNKDYVRKYNDSRTLANSGSVHRQLAGEAERNAISDTGTDFMTEPSSKAGVWSKTNDVPVIKNLNGSQTLEKAQGYVTKVGNDNLYIQKRGSEWVVNFKGMQAGYSKSSLAAAKTESQNVINLLQSSNGARLSSSANAQFRVLNRNGGKVSSKVWREIDIGYVERKI